MGELDIQILGSWDVLLNGQRVAVPNGQLSILLASLIQAHGQPVSVRTLAAQLWPEKLPGRVASTIHTYVARLRTLLGPNRIVTTPYRSYLLDTDGAYVDLHEFHRLLGEASRAADVEQELAALRSALTLWRGKPFGDMASTWLDRNVVPELTETWFAATERRIDLELATGRAAQLIGELEKMVNSYPTRESVWLRLMTALHRAGRRTDALAAYRRARATLNEEVGIEPGEELVQLHHTLLATDDVPPPSGSPHAVTASGPAHPGQRTPDLEAAPTPLRLRAAGRAAVGAGGGQRTGAGGE